MSTEKESNGEETKPASLGGVSGKKFINMRPKCEKCKVQYTYDWRLEYKTCPKCGNDKQ